MAGNSQFSSRNRSGKFTMRSGKSPKKNVTFRDKDDEIRFWKNEYKFYRESNKKLMEKIDRHRNVKIIKGKEKVGQLQKCPQRLGKSKRGPTLVHELELESKSIGK